MFVLRSQESDLVTDHPFFSSSNELQPSRIGVFDSGVGGLTVLKSLYRSLPGESFLYFGDTARLPYGIRSQSEILTFVREILGWMAQERVKMAIMACNTSSALALDIVRTEFDIPILGLILPGARAAVQQGRRIGVIATPATVASESYPRAIQEIDPEVQVWQVPCPEFVPLVEQDRIFDPYTEEVAQSYLQPLIQSRIDTLIYGCTHYPHLAPVIRNLLPHAVQEIDPGRSLAVAAAQELELLGLTNPQGRRQPTRFCVSGDAEQFAQVSQGWLGFLPEVETVNLSAAIPERETMIQVTG
jgi:glutamate racemase